MNYNLASQDTVSQPLNVDLRFGNLPTLNITYSFIDTFTEHPDLHHGSEIHGFLHSDRVGRTI